MPGLGSAAAKMLTHALAPLPVFIWALPAVQISRWLQSYSGSFSLNLCQSVHDLPFSISLMSEIILPSYNFYNKHY